MPPVQRSTRINLQDFKSKFLKILGPAKEIQYWNLLTSFLSFKLSKAELDKLVPSTIGKENVVLHNQFVRAIFSNATCSDAPAPPPSVHDTSKPVKGIRRKPLVTPSSVSATDEAGPASPAPIIRANGDGAIPPSPRKGRSAIRDRKAKERPSPLGFHHRGEASTSQGGNNALDEETPRGLENGVLKMPDLSRPAQQSPYPAEHSNLELPSPALPLAKRPRLAPTGAVSAGDGKTGIAGFVRPKEEFAEVAEENEEEEEEEDEEASLLASRVIKPPFGIPFCIASVGAPRRAPFVGMVGPLTHTLLGDGLEDECLEGSDLPDAEALQRRMQQIAVHESGLEAVSIDAAHLLNRALDVYLKRLIKSTIELGRARRSSRNIDKQYTFKENGGICHGREHRRDGNGLAFHRQMNGARPLPSMRDGIGVAVEGVSLEDAENAPSSISALDFKVAMEINPQLLGDEWPTLMEKIALRVFDQ